MKVLLGSRVASTIGAVETTPPPRDKIEARFIKQAANGPVVLVAAPIAARGCRGVRPLDAMLIERTLAASVVAAS